ncbi:CalY family protein [Bacillus piscicola]|uniref:CalY family protein n=1 Tax=Bacillus piscicola TaxID=1632684 RepID=UPI001F098859|nr:CalY family protein [Bacillus piscicola]
MKKTKKVLIATTMAGVLAVGAGFGTFSWFTASQASSEGQVDAGTLLLNDISEYSVFSHENIQPIDPTLNPEMIVEGDTINVQNTGSLDMVPRLRLDVEVRDADWNLAPQLTDEYMVTMNFKRNDMNWEESITKPVSAFLSRDFIDPAWFPSDDGFIHELGAGDSFDVSFDVYLNKDAGNEYQGSHLTGKLIVEGKQTVDGAEYENQTQTPQPQ